MTSRARFEAWYRERYAYWFKTNESVDAFKRTIVNPDVYEHFEVKVHWDIWQARDEEVRELEERVKAASVLVKRGVALTEHDTLDTLFQIFAELESVLRRGNKRADNQDRPGNHIFFNGVCKCGQRPTDDPRLCTFYPRET